MKIQDKKSRVFRVLMVVLGVCFVANAVAVPVYARKGGGGRRGAGGQGRNWENSQGTTGGQGTATRKQLRKRDGECTGVGQGAGERKMYQRRENNTQSSEYRQNRRSRNQGISTQPQENIEDEVQQ